MDIVPALLVSTFIKIKNVKSYVLASNTERTDRQHGETDPALSLEIQRPSLNFEILI